MDSTEYDKLKETYKEHYRKLKELKRKAAQSEYAQKITHALEDMDSSKILDSVDSMMDTLKEKIAVAEAKLSVFLETDEEETHQMEDDLEIQKFEARKTIEDLRKEMEYVKRNKNDLANKVQEDEESEVTKTLGRDSNKKTQASNPKRVIKKTLGPR